MIFNNTSTSREQNFSIPMTPIVDNNNFSNFLDSNDFLFSENHIKESHFQEEIPQNKANNDPNNNSSLLLYCNQTLANYGFSPIGELEGNFNEINKTVMVIYELLQQRQRDLEFRNDVIEKMAKLESDKNAISQNVVRLKTEIENLKKENGVLQNINKSLEKKFKIDKEKLVYEKDEVTKQLSKLSFKESQMLHEIRKKENETNKYKEQMKKTYIDKNSKNQHEILNNFTHNIQSSVSAKSPDHIFLNEIKEIHENVRQKLLVENQEIRNMFITFQNEMNRIIQDKKEIFMKKLLAEARFSENLMNFLEKYFIDINISLIKPEVFSLPHERTCNEVMSVFRKNLQKFEEFFQKIVEFNFFQYYFKEVKHELSEIHPNLGHSSSLKEFKTVLTKIKKSEILGQSSSVKSLKNEENKENENLLGKENENFTVKEPEKNKSFIIIENNPKELVNINDLSMSHFSKPFAKNKQTSSAGLSLKKKSPSLHFLNNNQSKNEENDDEIYKEVNRWEDCLNNKYGDI